MSDCSLTPIVIVAVDGHLMVGLVRRKQYKENILCSV